MNIPRNRLFWAVALGHMTNDTFISMAPVLLAFISVNVQPLSIIQIGIILSLMQLLGAITQPLFGWLADRNGGRWLGAGGVAWTVGMVLVALVAAEQGIVPLMILGFVIPALGSGAFHPVGSKYAAESDRTHAASNMAYFFLLGQLGLALGPALAGLLLDRAASFNNTFTEAFGPTFDGVLLEQGTVAPVMLVGVFAIPAVILMVTNLPNRQKHQTTKAATPPETQEARTVFPVMAFVILITMVTVRSLAQPGVVSFIPVLFQEKGWSPAEYGLIASSFWVGSGLAGVFFGNLADHYDRRRVIAVSMVAAAPAFFFMPVTDGVLAFILAIAAGALSGASHSIIVVMAQGFLPGSKALASGLILGLIFGMGALGNFLIGWISEQVGLGVAFQLVAGAVVIASLLALALPGERRAKTHPTADVVPTRA